MNKWPLTVEECYLRFLSHRDAPNLARHANDPMVAAYLTNAFPSPYSTEDAINFIDLVKEDKTKVIMAIAAGEEVVGCIGLHQTANHDEMYWELGYWLGRAFWNRGIATAAVTAFMSYIRTIIPDDIIYARVYRQNAASIKVLEKNGFILSAELFGKYLRNNKPASELIFSKIIKSNTDDFIK
jgi:RimJ/RimL family protein N-acetyltransferase